MANLNHVDINGSALTDYVIDCKYTDTKWYQLFKSGWLIQGGRETSKTADYATCNITFLKEFRNTNYCATTGTIQGADDGSWNGSYHIRTKSTASMSVYCRGAADGGRYIEWHCAGFAK